MGETSSWGLEKRLGLRLQPPACERTHFLCFKLGLSYGSLREIRADADAEPGWSTEVHPQHRHEGRKSHLIRGTARPRGTWGISP